VDWQLAGANTVTIAIALLIGFIGGVSAAYLKGKK
jgi:cell division protein FtsN